MVLGPFAEKYLSFLRSLYIDDQLPEGISVMNPYTEEEVIRVNRLFYHILYNDHNPRIMIIGINPGRFGGGVTGISFTDPVELERSCRIPNSFKKRPELSSEFIYKAIHHSGGVEQFFNRFLLTALSPLGFIKDGRNYNYYDSPALLKAVLPFIKTSLRQQYKISGSLKTCICIGEGTNRMFLEKLNKEMTLFNDIIFLPHPRFIMQYRRKRVGEFVEMYVEAFKEASSR